MAVGAYASVLSLMRALDNVLLPSRSRLLPDKTQIETLQQKLNLLQESLELLDSSNTTRSKQVLLDDLALIGQIREVANEADDVIDRYVVDQLRDEESNYDQSTGKSLNSSSFIQDIDLFIQKIESINHELMMTIKMDKDHYERTAQLLPTNSFNVGSSTPADSTGKSTNTMVGFEDHLVHIMDVLTGTEPNLRIIPIVGMGGIGKTTLARNTFDNKLVVENFDVRYWLTISQEYDVRKILLGLQPKGVLGDKKGADDLVELGTLLHKELFGARYLIVMDDVWDMKAWYDFKPFFPNNGNGSRIMMTTRLSNVADSLSPRNGYSIGFLNEEKSWELFHGEAFCNGGWSRELEEIGKKIVKNCRGLPLTLVVVGGLLLKSNGNLEYWELIANDMNSFANSEINENCLRTLSLSYNHLPIHLKLCFLYTGLFFGDVDIEVSRLVEIWVSEGVVKPAQNKNLEEVSMEYLEDLLRRNMILIHDQGNSRNISTCGIHDLLRQLCINESRKVHFYTVPKIQIINIDSSDFENSCFLCSKRGTNEKIHLDEVLGGALPTTLTSSLVCDDCNTMFAQLDRVRFIRLIDKVDGKIVGIPHPTKLRCLFISFDLGSATMEFLSPSMISLLWNLQFLFYYAVGDHAGRPLISRIWEMPQLRSLHLMDHVLPDSVDTKDLIVLQNLHTLTWVKNFRCTEDVVRRIPNLKILGVCYGDKSEGVTELDWSYYCLNNLALLHKLESLYLECSSVPLDRDSIAFPCSLKQLTLYGCELLWTDMAMIGVLPNLEVLQLEFHAFVGDEWCTVEGQFPKLKHLEIFRSGLVIWRAESSHFPVLETLNLFGLPDLEEFPLDIGDIVTLSTINVRYCSDVIVNSVKQIMEEQENYGNQLLRVIIKGVSSGRRRRKRIRF